MTDSLGTSPVALEAQGVQQAEQTPASQVKTQVPVQPNNPDVVQQQINAQAPVPPVQPAVTPNQAFGIKDVNEYLPTKKISEPQ